MCKLKIGLGRQYSTLSPSSTNPHMGSEAGSNSGTLRHIQTACKIKINSTSSVRLLHSLALSPFFFCLYSSESLNNDRASLFQEQIRPVISERSKSTLLRTAHRSRDTIEIVGFTFKRCSDFQT